MQVSIKVDFSDKLYMYCPGNKIAWTDDFFR